MDHLGILGRKSTAFIMVDIQDKILAAMDTQDMLVKNSNILLRTVEILDIPLVVTEQYPKGLGSTSGRISLPEKRDIVEKVSFSCFGCDEFADKIKGLGVKSIVLFGVEVHVCIMKTALEALKDGIEVHVVADAVSSRTAENKELALERMRQSGAFIASTEMIVFQLMDKAGTDEFKQISKLIR